MGFFSDIAPVLGGVGGFLVGGPAGAALGFGLGSSISSAQGQADAQREANSQNMRMVEDQMRFQREMSNTAYQRAMTDMSAAGLNPMLAFQQGGASTPGGAAGQVQPVNEKAAIGAAGQSAINNLQQVAELENKNSNTQLNLKNSAVADTVAERNVWSARESETQTFKTAAETNLIGHNMRVVEERKREAVARADQAEMDRDIQKARFHIDKKLAPIDAGMDRLEQGAGVAGSALGLIKRSGSKALKNVIRDEYTPRSETDALKRAGRKGIPID